MIDPSLMPELPKLPPLTCGPETGHVAVWTAEQFHAYATAYGLQCYRLAMERAAKLVEEVPTNAQHTVDAIRALALQNPALERMARIDDELGEQP